MWAFLPVDAFGDTTWSDAVPEHTTTCEFECDSCGHRTNGYQMGELMVEHGWRLHSTGLGRPCFVLCGDCMAIYTERWERRASA